MTPVKNMIGYLVIATAATAFTLVLLEGALRLFAEDAANERITGNQYQFYRYDPELGWSNAPGTRGTFQRSEFSFKLRINSHGLRGPETSLPKPAGIRRIAVLGDSFTWGIGASEDELFTTLIEQAIPQTEVLNFGVAGYGPIQYHLQTSKVLAFDPDLVVIAFCLGNDFADNVFWRRYGYYKPFARLDERGGLAIDGYPIPNVKQFSGNDGARKWLGWSRLYRLLDRTAFDAVRRYAVLRQKGPKFSEDQKDLYARPDAADVEGVVRVNAKLLELIAQAYRARGIAVIVLAAPTKCEFGACFPDLKSPNGAARGALARSLEGLAVTLVDPTASLSISDFWKKDAHWRASGHRKIADALLPSILRHLDGLRVRQNSTAKALKSGTAGKARE